MRIKKKTGTLYTFRWGVWEELGLYIGSKRRKPGDKVVPRTFTPLQSKDLVPPFLVILAAHVHPDSLNAHTKNLKFDGLGDYVPLRVAGNGSRGSIFNKAERNFKRVSRRELPLFMDWQTGPDFISVLKKEKGGSKYDY
jgi:hypothetical protein